MGHAVLATQENFVLGAAARGHPGPDGRLDLLEPRVCAPHAEFLEFTENFEAFAEPVRLRLLLGPRGRHSYTG